MFTKYVKVIKRKELQRIWKLFDNLGEEDVEKIIEELKKKITRTELRDR